MTPDNDGTITLSCVGDICFGLKVREQIQKNGYDYIFSKVKSRLSSADIRFGNLEVVLLENLPDAKWKSDIWVLNDCVECLANIDFDVLSFANNHIMDFGSQGVLNTLEILSDNNIFPVGAGKSDRHARKPIILERKGIKIGFLAYADDTGQKAKTNKTGAAEAVRKNILPDVSNLKQEVNVSVVSLHMGLEFTGIPSPHMVGLARDIVDAGADVVVCHHPHVLQGYEEYHDSLICYGLGNFVFQVHGNEYQESYLPYTSWGMIAEIELNKKGYVDHNIIPTLINEEHRPTMAEDIDSDTISKYLHSISDVLKDPYELEKHDRMVASKYAIKNYWWLRAILRNDGLFSGVKRLFILVLRPCERRWVVAWIKNILRFPIKS